MKILTDFVKCENIENRSKKSDNEIPCTSMRILSWDISLITVMCGERDDSSPLLSARPIIFISRTL